MMQPLHRWYQRWQQQRRRNIYHVADKQNWALHWVAHYTVHYLRQRHGLPAYYATDPWAFRNQIIHFTDRYAYLYSDLDALHSSNQVFMTWYHGDLDDPNPDMQDLFRRLPRVLPYLQKIVTSCTASQTVLQRLGVPSEQIEIIEIGVDLQSFTAPTATQRQQARQRYGIPQDALCIGSFQKDGQGWGDGGEPKRIKGPDVFLEVVEQLATQYPNIVIFLTGPARGYVKNGLDRLGVRYVHHYFDEYQAIATAYHALDLYLITSRTEGGPKALMEAWASGVPLVSTHMGMPADWLHPGQNGLSAPVNDVPALTAQARRMIEDAELRARCVANGLEDVKPLDWAVLSDKFAALYRPYL